MARPKNQEARRTQLISAAAKKLRERGAARVKLRDIAEEAQVTPASVLYYYKDVQDLFVEVFARGADRYCAERERRIAEADGPVARLRVCVRSGVVWPGAAEETSRMLYELFPVALREQPALAIQRDFFDRQTALYQEILEQGADAGEFTLPAPAPHLARTFLALEDGYALEVLAGGITAEEEERRLLAFAHLATGNNALAPAD
ncbi:TetR/AcrR family transcriptional regulator [Streptomyces sp. NPDC015350]|uniref:TetR/AcrR family transcriptional regulator n=1 Tax=Streptomyces sp. NPDC015350 TaxID=3364955 RepID=UPI0036F6B565